MSWHIAYVCVKNGQILQSICYADFKWDLIEIGAASFLTCGTAVLIYMLVADLMDRRTR